MDGEEGTEGASSRIFVQGLPKYLEDKRFREVFAEKGDITDAKIIKTKDGRSRQFGFIGFTTMEQAKEAIRYFNNSYIDTARIHVKFAEKTNSSHIARPWSKYSAGSSQFQKRHREENATSSLPAREAKKQKRAKYSKTDPADDDPELAEFLEVMQPRSKGAIWSNDTVAASKRPETHKSSEKREASRNTDDEDDDLFEELPPKRAKKEPTKKTKRKTKDTGTQDIQDPGRTVPDSKDKALANAEISDLEYLKSRMKADKFKEEDSSESNSTDEESSSESDDSDDDDDDESSSQDESEADSEGSDRTGLKAGHIEDQTGVQGKENQSQQAVQQDADSKGPPPISETGRLFLRNLPYQATEADLTSLFEEYGELSEVHLVVDRATGVSKGFALVQFMEPADAEAAFSALDASIFQGRLLHILPAKPAMHIKPSRNEEDGEAGVDPKDFRRRKEEDAKAEAGNRQAWNSLFMRQDTVAEAIAAHFNVSKADLLDRDAADLPVRMALGEAHVIAMTKKGLEEGGADTSLLEKASQAAGKATTRTQAVDRSTTTLLAKNLSYTATETDLLDLFGRHGIISRLVLPETKTLALVEFQDADSARRAFKALAKKRVQNVPLFLEWAPQGIFRPDAPKRSDGQGESLAGEAQTSEAPDVENDSNTESPSIYVKNLPWSTTNETLLKHFDATISASGGSIRAAKVAQHKDKQGRMVSAGYGFVECNSEAMAKLAIKKLQASVLEGHKLELQLSMKKGLEPKKDAKEGEKRKDAKATKVVVRNVAFEAKAKEVRALFQPFGQVKSVRLPQKFDGSHRGFAFVDFLSHKEAVNAMENVNGTHLYGRRLVCEWAAQDEGLDNLRAKTAAKLKG